MTYSPEHVADGQRMIELADALERDLNELRHMLSIYDDAVTMQGRHPAADAGADGRKGTTGPSRPTESTALDPDREALKQELKIGVAHVLHALVIVRGVTASMDRALLRWEGEDADQFSRGL